MLKYLLNNNFLKKELVFLVCGYFTLLISFISGENSTGGAIIDYFNQKNVSVDFSNNFISTLLNYDAYSTRHSPVLIIILSFFENINFSDNVIRLIHLHYCILLPLFFFKCLEIKFKNIDKKFIYFIVFLIFLSPTFRTLSIWPDSRLSGLIFFTIGIFFYLKFLNEKKFYFVILNIIFVAISSYFSPNFSVFSIFFLIQFFFKHNLTIQRIFIIIITNIILAFPALYYVFILEINFFNKPAAIGITDNEKIIFNNIFNDILITFSLFLFYITPFILSGIINLSKFTNIKNLILSTLIFLLCLANFDYNLSFSGGGIFLKGSYFLFKNNYLFYLISFISILIILPLIYKNNVNILLFVLILLNNPQYTIYHKYFDPFLLITFFTIFSFKSNLKKLELNKNLFFVFFYFLAFLLISNLKYLWKI